MFFWFIFILLFLFLIYSPKSKGSSKKQYLAIALIVIVGIFRFDIGWDYPNYYTMALTPKETSLARLEMLNKWVYHLIYRLDYPPLLFMIYGVLTYYLIISTLKRYSGDFYIAMCIYVAFFYQNSFGPIRQALAVAFVLYGYRYLCSNNFFWGYVKYAICVIVAGMWHNSAYVAIFIPLIYRYMNLKWFILFCVFILGAYQLLITKFAAMLGYEGYLRSVEDYSGGSLARYAYVLIFISALLLYRKLKTRDLETERLFYITAFGMFLPFLIGGHLGGRVAQFFYIFYCLLLPRILRCYTRQVRSWYVCGMATYFLLLIYVSTMNPIKTPFTPYQTIFTVDWEHPTFKKERLVIGGR